MLRHKAVFFAKKQRANAVCRYGGHAHIAARRIFFGNKHLPQAVIHILRAGTVTGSVCGLNASNNGLSFLCGRASGIWRVCKNQIDLFDDSGFARAAFRIVQRKGKAASQERAQRNIRQIHGSIRPKPYAHKTCVGVDGFRVKMDKALCFVLVCFGRV